MNDGVLFQNNFQQNENEENFFNLNLSFQNDELSLQNMPLFNQEIINNPNENNNSRDINNNIFPIQEENINNINNDLSLNPNDISPKENLEEFNDNNNNNLFEKENNFNISDSQSQSNSTKGSGEKEKTNDKSKLIEKEENKKNNLGKKRKQKQRIHLEDLNIDPEIIKYKKYQTIGDKVITSKNSKITDLERKEIRAIRNRISAQKSRDRKKAEFNELQMKVKYFEELTKKQNLMMKEFEKILCPECRNKYMEIKLNISLDNKSDDDEYLVLDEDLSFIYSDKKNISLTKLTGALITLVCLIGIVICFVQSGVSNNLIKNRGINNINKLSEQKITLRQLNEEKNLDDDNDNDIIDNNNNDIEIKEENILMPINKAIFDNTNNNIYINQLQLYHDRFGIEINSYLEKKNKIKNGFLMKQQTYNKTNQNSVCIETKNIEHNNYIIDNNSLNNTYPIEANNMLIDNNLSHKIISLFVKDYNTLNRYINGKSLTLQEQIEIEAKNSEDGCVYLQMIIPNYENEDDNNTLNSEYKNSFFEIRCKIFAYNNYYESKLARSTATSY